MEASSWDALRKQVTRPSNPARAFFHSVCSPVNAFGPALAAEYASLYLGSGSCQFRDEVGIHARRS
jgi:hypothetical protein